MKQLRRTRAGMGTVLMLAGALAGIATSSRADAAAGDAPGPSFGPSLGPSMPGRIEASALAVIVNEADPLSVATGEYYQRRRGIPDRNVIRVSFDKDAATMTVAQFSTLKAEVDAKTPQEVQGFALTWVRPYRVDCMSVTTAFAAGYDPQFCSNGCQATRFSAYFDSDSRLPYRDLRLRPAMSIAALGIEQARALIDRGVASDASRPRGTAYLVTTEDQARNVRSAGYADARLLAGARIRIDTIGEPVQGRSDVMFYFIGASAVSKLASNRFLPGAVADHLTSFGGDLLGGGQMSSLRWLEAGATGSYGAVAEPCNYTAKFPNVGLMMKHYLGGETLLEAYWKSVAMPGQGLFVGEPLARPFGE